MPTNLYASLACWTGSEIHTKNIDVGPRGDVHVGHIGIKGDQWDHKRIGYADAPSSKIKLDTDKARVEVVTNQDETTMYTVSPGSPSDIPIASTEDFEVGQRIALQDSASSEITAITSVTTNTKLQANVVGTYTEGRNATVSQLKKVYLEEGEATNFTVGDIALIVSGEKWIVVDIVAVDAATDYVEVRHLYIDVKKGDYIHAIVASTWTRDTNNPIINLGRQEYFDYYGQDVHSAEYTKDADVQFDTDNKELWRKPGHFVSCSKESGTSQIALMLSTEDIDVNNWTPFLGVNNTARPNPVIRHGYEIETFNEYATEAAMLKVWNTEDGDITVNLDTSNGYAGSCCLKLTYTDSGETWGLMPEPINLSTYSDDTDIFEFKLKNAAGNSDGDLYIKLVAADGTCYVHNFSGVLDASTSLLDKTFDFSSFAGRKYVTAVAVGISLAAGVIGNIVYLDRIQPFMPAVWDEIIEDPTAIGGNSDIGQFAVYYTARERPREIITSNNTSAGSSNVVVDVASTTNFKAGNVVMIYDRNGYEVGMIDTVASPTRLLVKHRHYDDDNSATFINDYATAQQSMIANNTYEVSNIGGAVVLKEDVSEFDKWITDGNRVKILRPSATATDFDALAVKQPSVKLVNNVAYMAYVGTCASQEGSIGIAISSNFTTFTKKGEGAVISPSAVGASFDTTSCLHPDLFMKSPYNIIHYTGFDGTCYEIGSAVNITEYQNQRTAFTMLMMVYPCASLGNPQTTGAVLFDQGNLRVEVDKNNFVTAWGIDVEENEYDTSPPDDSDPANGFPMTLINNRWNLVSVNWTGKQIKLGVNHLAGKFFDPPFCFTDSPWMLSSDLAAGAVTCTLERQFSWVDGVTDFGGVGQEIVFYGSPTDSSYAGYKYEYNYVTGVSQIGATDSFVVNLSNPIGPWGFSSTNLDTRLGIALSTNMGVVLAQGALIADRSTWYARGLRTEERTNDTDSYLLRNTRNYRIVYFPIPGTSHVFVDTWGEHDFRYSNASDKKQILSPQKAAAITVGSDVNLQRSWNRGYIGHIELQPGSWEADEKMPYFYQIYINNINTFSTEVGKWHLFDLSGVGATPDSTKYACKAMWDLTWWDATNSYFEEKIGQNHMFLLGSASHVADGFLGDTLKMTNESQDAGSVLLINGDFTKQNSGNPQFQKGATGWDETDVMAPNLFDNDNKFRLGYTGLGKVRFQTTGEIVGDIFEAHTFTHGVTFDCTFNIRTGTSLELYLSWEKTSNWYKIYDTNTPGTQTYNDFVSVPGSTTSPYYFARWKVILHANDALTNSPEIRSFSVEYTAPPTTPSAEFIAAQRNFANKSPVYKVEHIRSDKSAGEANRITNITSYIKSISNLTQEFNTKPDNLGAIKLSDVSMKCFNEDLYFSEQSGTSPFNSRDYTKDEIRVYSGFKISGTAEYEIAGRFFVNKIIVDNKKGAMVYCRSLLREALDTTIGLKENNEDNPVVYAGQFKVKDLIEDLLITYCNLNPEELHIEDYDRKFSNVTVNEKTVGYVIQKLAQACDGIVYTNNQGDIYFKTWDSLVTGTFLFNNEMYDKGTGLRYTGIDRDRIIKQVEVQGAALVQGSSSDSALNSGKIITVKNEYIQLTAWANDIADNIISRFGIANSEVDISSCFIPSVNLLDTVQVTDTNTGLSLKKYLVTKAIKNITDFSDKYELMSNLAVT